MSLTSNAITSISSELEKELLHHSISKVIVHGEYAEPLIAELNKRFPRLDYSVRELTPSGTLERDHAYVISTRSEDLHYYDSSYNNRHVRELQPVEQ